MRIIKLANEIFKNTKPLEGKEMEILNKTFKKLLSKTPTRL
jgi:hypothetical protein